MWQVHCSIRTTAFCEVISDLGPIEELAQALVEEPGWEGLRLKDASLDLVSQPARAQPEGVSSSLIYFLGIELISRLMAHLLWQAHRLEAIAIRLEAIANRIWFTIQFYFAYLST